MKNLLKKSLCLLTLLTVDQINCYPLFVKTLQGQTLEADVEKDAPISELYRQISEKIGIPVEDIKLIVSGKQIPNDDTPIKMYGLHTVAVINAVFKKPAVSAEAPVSAAAVAEVAIDELAACRAEVVALKAENAELLGRMLL